MPECCAAIILRSAYETTAEWLNTVLLAESYMPGCRVEYQNGRMARIWMTETRKARDEAVRGENLGPH